MEKTSATSAWPARRDIALRDSAWTTVSTLANSRVSWMSAQLHGPDPRSERVDHHDTEKCPGMFGTLIVAPPGLYAGGALVIRHREHEARVDLRAPDPAEACFAAFYADCRHEVRPVEGGYRLALVYNLRRAGKGCTPAPPIYDRERRDIAALLARWRKDGAAPEKIVLPLEHAYSPAEISFASLKGADQAAAKTLREAARDADCDIHLALLHRRERLRRASGLFVTPPVACERA